jgi:hypothetical protein
MDSWDSVGRLTVKAGIRESVPGQGVIDNKLSLGSEWSSMVDENDFKKKSGETVGKSN